MATLRRIGDLVLGDLDRPALLAAVPDADILWVRLRHAIDAEVIERSPRLRYIVSPTTGLNHIDLVAAERRGIQILSLRGEQEFLRNVRATAEHTLALILALLRHIPAATRHVAGGGWDRDAFRGRELFGKTAGLVGFGRLGRMVGRYLTAFEMHLLATDPSTEGAPILPAVRFVPLMALLREADVVTLHASYSEENRRFFGAEEFATMKPGAVFVNTARGELVDETALLESLKSGRLAGAALDVLSDEWSGRPADHPLAHHARAHDNLIITPHIGGCTTESMHKTEAFLATRLSDLCHAPLVPLVAPPAVIHGRSLP
jgi:D-3-phosphoglycerate dehydrogenase